MKMILRRDTNENWESLDPVLAENELVADLTFQKLKLGDGETRWSCLPYIDDLYFISLESVKIKGRTILVVSEET